MKKIIFFAIIIIIVILAFFLFWEETEENGGKTEFAELLNKQEIRQSKKEGDNYQELKDFILAKFNNIVPKQWGEKIEGVKTKLETDKKVIALTFDACGGSGGPPATASPEALRAGSGYDEKLINYLKDNNIPATLFINSRWIDANPKVFEELAGNSLFEIANHGTSHLPCSASGKEAYGIKGTNNNGEIFDEIEKNAEKIEKLIGRKTKYFRSGTANYDEVCVKIAEELGYEIVGFSVNGDAGATYSSEQVKKSLLGTEPGSIVIMHMNQPEAREKIKGETAEGLIEAIPLLKEKGFEFVKLSDYELTE